MIKVHRNGCARALDNQGPQKAGVWTLNVDLKFSTCKVRKNNVFSPLAPLGNPVFPGKCGHFFRPENSQAPFSGGGSDAEQDLFRCNKVLKEGSVRTLE